MLVTGSHLLIDDSRNAGAAVPPPGVEAPPPWTDPHAQEARSQDVHAGCGPDLRIMEPADERQRYIIDMLASYVLKDGCDLEQVGTVSAGFCCSTIICSRI